MLNDTRGRTIGFASALILSALFIFLAAGAFSLPPISDSWEMFRFFHACADRPHGWLHILNHDPFENIRFQPLSRVFYFVLHSFAGSDFRLFRAANMLAYAACVWGLWLFGGFFIRRAYLRFAAAAVFAFCFSHFDMVFWPSHIYILAGLCFILFGFTLFARWLRAGSGPAGPVAAGLLLLAGALCYEAFWLLPAAILAFPFIDDFRPEGSVQSGKSGFWAACAVLSFCTALALALFFFTRSLGTYPEPARTLASVFSLRAAPKAAVYAAFDILYNCIAVNLWPLAAFPLDVSENIYMGGTLINRLASGSGSARMFVLIVGTLFAYTAETVLYLIFRRSRQLSYSATLLCLLMFAPLFIIFFCRAASNADYYALTEFRYQLAPNAFGALLLFYLLDRAWPHMRKSRKQCFCVCLAAAMLMNIVCIRRAAAVYREQLGPLGAMLANVRGALGDGTCSRDKRLFVDPALTDFLPHLCWNMDIGEWFMDKGTYEWLFSRKELESFAFDRGAAAFEIDPARGFAVVPLGRAGRGRAVNDIFSPWYIALPKDEKYLDLARSCIIEGRNGRARELLGRALWLNPNNTVAADLLSGLGAQGKE